MALLSTRAAAVAAALAAIAPLTQAIQPGAVEALPAPMRPLQWGEINFLHTTDTHGWHAGHLQESQYSADWGDYVSFAEHMRKRADDEGVDLLLIDTGDRVEGNGLYDGSEPKGEYTYDIFREQDIDVICTGNHELYQADTADRENRQTVPNFAGRYLASNLDYIDPVTGEQRPMSPQRYRRFRTKNRGLRVVAFGFLFDFTGNANNTVVQPVAQTVREPWFQQVIQADAAEATDLFVVIGHIGARMGELRTIYAAIRAQNPDTPIAMFAGHAHVRDTVQFDDRMLGLASGRYFETIGWMSVSGVGGDKTQSPTFQRRYIDNNLLGLHYHTGLNASTFPTDHGRNVSAFITDARTDLQLDARYGCAPQNYWLQRRPHDSPDSLFALLRTRVLPEAIVQADRAHVPRLVLTNTGALRFDIFQGPFTRDTTYIVSPFVSLIRFIPDVPYAQARRVLGILNSYGRILGEEGTAEAAATAAEAMEARKAAEDSGLDWRELNVPEQYTRRTAKPGAAAVAAAFPGGDDDSQKTLGDSGPYPLVAGYTTEDDLGSDGDDAEHAPLPYHLLPNCIQAAAGFSEENSDSGSNPETVDLVFFDFIENYVLLALRIAGGHRSDGKAFTNADVATYIPGKFTDHFAEWVKKNWKDDC